MSYIYIYHIWDVTDVILTKLTKSIIFQRGRYTTKQINGSNVATWQIVAVANVKILERTSLVKL